MHWVEALQDVVKHHWSATGKAYLLSGVKTALRVKGVDVETALSGRKLKDALLEDGGEYLRLVRDPEHLLVWGVLPRETEIPANAADLFADKSDTEDTSESPSPRFGRGVWTAFSKPLSIGCRRYLEIGPPSKMYDVHNGTMPPPFGMEVEEEYVYDPSEELVPNEKREAEIEASIRRWAEAKDVAIDRLIVGSGFFEGKGRPRRAGVDFDHMDFSRLTREEKARILIPLDLLSKVRFGR